MTNVCSFRKLNKEPVYNRAIIVYMKGFLNIVRQVEAFLKANDIKVSCIDRKEFLTHHFKNIDLVISIGGDGTFLRASHPFFDDTPIVGINPDPKRKEGFFTSALISDYKGKLCMLLEGKYKKVFLGRLYAKINGKIIHELALNEFYFGRRSGYHMSHYELTVGGKTEFQKSSGVIIGTPQSSYSWIGSAGGKKLKLTDRLFQFIVREPYFGKLCHAKNLKGILKPGQVIRLKPLTKNFILVVDSLKAIPLNKCDMIEIGYSEKFLHFVDF
jgi:NAD+ kinase